MKATTLTASVVLLLSGAVSLVRPSAGEDEAPNASPMFLSTRDCRRAITIVANESWQALCVNFTDMYLNDRCWVKVNFSAAVAASAIDSDQLDGQTAVLVRLYRLKVLLPGYVLWRDPFALLLLGPPDMVAEKEICRDTIDIKYVWVSKPFHLDIMIMPMLPNNQSLYCVGLAAVRPVNVCQKSDAPSGRVGIEGELYAFAPDSRLSALLPNSTVSCSNRNELVFAATDLMNSIILTVLAAPANSSCWSLWLDGHRFTGTETRSITTGNSVNLLYTRDTGSSTCNCSQLQHGFTIKVRTVPTTTAALTISANSASSTDLTDNSKSIVTSSVALAAGSAVASATVAVAVTIAVACLVIHRRGRRHHTSLNGSGPQAIASASRLTDTQVYACLNYEQSDHLYEVLPLRR